MKELEEGIRKRLAVKKAGWGDDAMRGLRNPLSQMNGEYNPYGAALVGGGTGLATYLFSRLLGMKNGPSLIASILGGLGGTHYALGKQYAGKGPYSPLNFAYLNDLLNRIKKVPPVTEEQAANNAANMAAGKTDVNMNETKPTEPDPHEVEIPDDMPVANADKPRGTFSPDMETLSAHEGEPETPPYIAPPPPPTSEGIPEVYQQGRIQPDNDQANAALLAKVTDASVPALAGAKSFWNQDQEGYKQREAAKAEAAAHDKFWENADPEAKRNMELMRLQKANRETQQQINSVKQQQAAQQTLLKQQEEKRRIAEAANARALAEHNRQMQKANAERDRLQREQQRLRETNIDALDKARQQQSNLYNQRKNIPYGPGY